MGRWFRRKPDSSTAGSSHAAETTGPQQSSRQPPPAIDPHELRHSWLRILTVIGDGKGIDETLALIAKVNHAGTHTVPIRTALPAEDRQAIEDVMAWNHEIRNRQAGVNLLIEQLLIRWLSEATGQTWNQIVQRLALTIEQLPPPEQR
jgi:hypothetical protein